MHFWLTCVAQKCLCLSSLFTRSFLKAMTGFLSLRAKGLRFPTAVMSLTPSYSSFNPLGPKSDQHQFSPNNISKSSRVLGYENY